MRSFTNLYPLPPQVLFAVYSVLVVADAVLNKAMEPTSPSSEASPAPGASSGPDASLGHSASSGPDSVLASLKLLAQRRDMLSHTLRSSAAGIDGDGGKGSSSRQGLGQGAEHPSALLLPLPALSWEQVRM